MGISMNRTLMTLLVFTSLGLAGRGADSVEDILTRIMTQNGISELDRYQLQNMVRSRAVSYELERGVAGNAVQYQDFGLLAGVLANKRLQPRDLAPYLHMKECNAQCVKMLTDYGCSPDNRQEGKVPLHRAASNEDLAKVIALLNARANRYINDEHGNNVAHIAAAECISLKVASEILQHVGHARECKNHRGLTAIDIFLERVRENCR